MLDKYTKSVGRQPNESDPVPSRAFLEIGIVTAGGIRRTCCGQDIVVIRMMTCGQDIVVIRMTCSGQDIVVIRMMSCGQDIVVIRMMSCGQDVVVIKRMDYGQDIILTSDLPLYFELPVTQQLSTQLSVSVPNAATCFGLFSTSSSAGTLFCST